MNKPTYEELEAQVKQLAAERDAVVAENVALKAAFTPKEIPTGATDVFSDIAILKIDGDEFHSSQWVDNETDVIRAVLGFFKPETPATESILASRRAEGVEMAFEAAKPEVANEFQRETFDQCVTAAVKYPQSDLAGKVEMVAWLELFAAQLRSESEVQS